MEWKNKKHGRFGWMKRCLTNEVKETPAQIEAREAAAAQKKADIAAMLNRGQDVRDPDLPLNASMQTQAKITGGMGYDGAGKTPQESADSAIT